MLLKMYVFVWMHICFWPHCLFVQSCAAATRWVLSLTLHTLHRTTSVLQGVIMVQLLFDSVEPREARRVAMHQVRIRSQRGGWNGG